MTGGERVELAVEHALREGLVSTAELGARGGAHAGDVRLRTVLRLRRAEPPTESYAETRAVQLLRSAGHNTWRQLHVMSGRQILHRVDLVIPFEAGRRRPEVLRPEHGLLVEIDGREVHEPQFERDHKRQSTYDALGYHWVSFTPNQIERSARQVLAAIDGALKRRRATGPTKARDSPHSRRRTLS
jgi:very-short-patch-repair endonuclease